MGSSDERLVHDTMSCIKPGTLGSVGTPGVRGGSVGGGGRRSVGEPVPGFVGWIHTDA